MRDSSMRREPEESRLGLELRAQEVHLVGQNAAVRQRQELRPVRHIGHGEQRHVRLFGTAAALARIAALAGGDDVRPHVAAAARQRLHVIARELMFGALRSAVHAHEAVAPKQFVVVQGWRSALDQQALARALHGDDAVHDDARTQAGFARDAAADFEFVVACRPRDEAAAVQRYRILPGHPSYGCTGDVEAKYQWYGGHG